MKKTTLLLFCCIAAALNLFSQAGTLDSSFGVNGLTNFKLYPFHSEFNDVALQSDGKIIAVGKGSPINTENRAAVIRYTKNGVVDSTFGVNGLANTDFTLSGDYYSYHASGVAITPDDKIIVAITGERNFLDDLRFFLVRYNEDGTIDENFGNNGYVRNNSDNKISLNNIILLPDGKIIVGGSSIQNHYSKMLRYNSNGTLDETFGMNGSIAVEAIRKHNHINSYQLNSSGQIIIGGYDNRSLTASPFKSNVFLAMYNQNGEIDSSFGTNGIVSLGNRSNNEFATALYILPDDKILVCGNDDDGVDIFLTTAFLLKLNANGSLDQSFGHNGILEKKYERLTASNAYDLAVQQDGKIVLIGSGEEFYKSFLTVARFNPDGSPDETFNNNGIVLAKNIETDNFTTTSGYALAIQADGNILVAGVQQNNLLLGRYLGGDNNSIAAQTNEAITVKSASRISLFPNPVMSKLTVTGMSVASSYRLSITDNSGRLIIQAVCKNQNNFSLNVEKLQPGIYYLQARNGNELTTLKFLKQ